MQGVGKKISQKNFHNWTIIQSAWLSPKGGAQFSSVPWEGGLQLGNLEKHCFHHEQ
jgi:hypothetical protein